MGNKWGHSCFLLSASLFYNVSLLIDNEFNEVSSEDCKSGRWLQKQNEGHEGSHRKNNLKTVQRNANI